MYKISYHNHSTYSDGKNTMSEMAKAAYELGFTHYAFTDHNHIANQESWTVCEDEAGDYLCEIERLKNEYEGKMKIYSGIEVDWYHNVGSFEIFTQSEQSRVDIKIGSVHQISKGGVTDFIDGDPLTYEHVFKDNFNSDPHAFVEEYFASMQEMIRNMRPTLVAHADIIRIHNSGGKYFSENDMFYCDLIEQLAKTMKEYNCVSEVNGGGDFRHHNNVFYPSDNLMGLFKELDIPLTIGLDAHSVGMLDAYYDRSLKMMLDTGYKEIALFDEGEWNKVDIKEFM